jgi:metal transporter CNNM
MADGYSILGVPVNMSVWMLLMVIAVLVLLAGLMAGLIISVFSFDVARLRTLSRRTTTLEGQRARKLLLILRNPHWLLVTLVVVDSAATEMLPLLFNVLVNPAMAVVVSVVLLVVFGEIIPEALFTHHALAFASALAPLISILMVVTAPISWPVGRMLDWCVGSRSSVAFKRGQLREVIRYRGEMLRSMRADGDEVEPLHERELEADEHIPIQRLEMQIMLGVLSLSEHEGSSVLKKGIGATFTVHRDAIITKRMIQSMAAHKLTFIPVYKDASNPSDVTQVFELRLLLFLAYCEEGASLRIRDLPLLPLPRYNASTPCNVLLEYLHQSPLQVAALTNPQDDSKVVGIVSTADVVELVHATSFDCAYSGSAKVPRDAVVQSFRENSASLAFEARQRMANHKDDV